MKLSAMDNTPVLRVYGHVSMKNISFQRPCQGDYLICRVSRFE